MTNTDTSTEDKDGPIWVHEFREQDVKPFVTHLQAQSLADPKRPIVIYIDSYGGSTDALVSMLAAMDSVPNPIVTVALGKAMSCGAILLSHGDTRYVAPRASVMIHEISFWARGHVRDVVVDVHESVRLDNELMGLLAENCGKKLPTLRRLWKEKRDIYLTPADAVTFGIADHVGMPRLTKKTTTTWELVTEKQS